MTVKNVKGQKRVWKFKYEQNKQEAEAVMACHSVDLEEDEDEDGYRDRAGDEKLRPRGCSAACLPATCAAWQVEAWPSSPAISFHSKTLQLTLNKNAFH